MADDPSNVVSLDERRKPKECTYSAFDGDAKKLADALVSYTDGNRLVTLWAFDEDPLALTPEQAEALGVELIQAARVARAHAENNER